MDNASLKTIYESIYLKGEGAHYTKSKYHLHKEIHEAILAETVWEGKSVLDVGSGAGDFASLLSHAGASSVLGIDYSPEATKESKQRHQNPGLRYETKNLFDMTEGYFDVIVSLGTIEHMNDPLEGIRRMLSLLNKGGSIIVTVPNWLNPRGYVLLTLLFLFKAKITLADLHHLSPVHFEKWAKELDMELSWKTVNHSWGSGDVSVADLRDRLPKIAKSSGLPLNVKGIAELAAWLEENSLPLHAEPTPLSGAIGIFHLKAKF